MVINFSNLSEITDFLAKNPGSGMVIRFNCFSPFYTTSGPVDMSQDGSGELLRRQIIEAEQKGFDTLVYPL